MLYETENWTGLYGELASEALAWTPGFKNIHIDIEMNIIVNDVHTHRHPLFIKTYQNISPCSVTQEWHYRIAMATPNIQFCFLNMIL